MLLKQLPILLLALLQGRSNLPLLPLSLLHLPLLRLCLPGRPCLSPLCQRCPLLLPLLLPLLASSSCGNSSTGAVAASPSIVPLWQSRRGSRLALHAPPLHCQALGQGQLLQLVVPTGMLRQVSSAVQVPQLFRTQSEAVGVVAAACFQYPLKLSVVIWVPATCKS